ncbi:MAG TPA: hypothetical protein VIN06_02520 [Devosia sp.]
MTEPKKLDPIISEFATQEEADEYDAWFRKKVQESLDDPRPDVPHEEVMREMDEIIRRAAARGFAEGKQAIFDPITSEFASQEEADDYDAWFRKQVQESLDDPAPDVSHEEVVAGIEAILEAASRRKSA